MIGHNIKGLSIFLFIALFFIKDISANESSQLKLLSPSKELFYIGGFASIVAKIENNETNKLEIILNNKKSFIFDVNTTARNIYCKTFELEMGKNEITITSFSQNAIYGEKKINIYRTAEVHEGFDEAPDNYKKSFFHNEQNEKECKACHKIGTKSASVDFPENPEDSPCYECHKPLLSKKNSHAPAINFMCTQCHAGETDDYNIQDKGKSKYLAKDPIESKCYACHENIEADWTKRKSEHGPVKFGRCNKCHNPHSSDNEFFLNKGIWDLCTTCHSEKADGAHVVGGFVFGKSHPTKGRPDPARPGRELVCSGCHDPHGSESKFLLRTKGMGNFSICKRCHNKY